MPPSVSLLVRAVSVAAQRISTVLPGPWSLVQGLEWDEVVNKLTPYGGKTTKIFLENRIEVFLTFQETGLKHPINNLYLKTTRGTSSTQHNRCKKSPRSGLRCFIDLHDRCTAGTHTTDRAIVAGTMAGTAHRPRAIKDYCRAKLQL